MAPAQTTVGCPVPHSQELSSIGSVGDSYDNAMAEWQWTAMGFVDGSEKLGLWFRLPSWFSSIPDGLRSGCGTRSRNETWSYRSQCSIHDVTSLTAFLLVWQILLVDEFFPARVALNDSAAALYVAHAGSSHRSEETILVHGGGVLSGRALVFPRLDMKNRHTLDGLAVPNRQFCRAFWTNSVRMCSAMA